MFPFILVPLALALGFATHDVNHDANHDATPTPAVARTDSATVIEFENQGWDLATVYAVPRGGLAVRLGQVTPGSTERFVVPRGALTAASSVDIVAVPFGRRFAVRSGPIAIYPGDALHASMPSTENTISVLPAR